MMMEIKTPTFEKNLSILRSQDPSLAERMNQWKGTSKIQINVSKTGKKIPVVNQVSLHSRYDPVKEAQEWFQTLGAEPEPSLLFGLGFGYHLDLVLEKTASSLVVIEPSLDLFCLWVNEIDISPYLTRVKFIIGETPAKAVTLLEGVQNEVVSHLPSVRLNKKYFEEIQRGFEFNSLVEGSPLKVLVIPPIYGGSLPTARYCYEALESMGHKVFWTECNKMEEAFQSLGKFSSNCEHSEILSRKFLEFISEAIVARAAEVRPDVILALAQAPLDRKTVERLKGLEVPVAFWFPEDFRTLTYWEEMASSYDYFFTFQKGEFSQRLDALGNVDYYYLPQACNPSTHKKYTSSVVSEEFCSEISFMGAPYYNRVQSFVRLLDLPFKIWGEGWDKEGAYKNCLQKDGNRISTKETVDIFNGTNININLHSSTFHEGVNPNGDFVNPRTFEIASCGGFQLVDFREHLPFLFDIENELVVYRNINELKEKILYFQKNPEERNAFATAAYNRVIKEHTFKHRMREMLTHIFIDRLDNLKESLSKREEEWSNLVIKSASGTSLENYIKPFKDCESFSLKMLKETIEEGEGDLSDPELLILMVNQVVH